MRALIVGGHGAIGSAVARHADKAGIETHIGTRSTSNSPRLAAAPTIRHHRLDATDAASVRRVIDMVRPDWVVMAALPGVGHASGEAECRQLLLGMCKGVLSVLESLRDARFAGPLTWIGSATCYGDTDGGWRPGAAMVPRTFRGAVKASESLLVARLAAQAGIALTELRVFTGYGPYEQRDRLVPSLLRAGLTGGLVGLSPVPRRRDWVHYEDIAAACLASTAAATSTARAYNVCSGEVHDTQQVATLLEDIVGKRLISDTPYRHGDCYGDAEPGHVPAVAEGLEWQPRISLAQGLAQCWRWARSKPGRDYLLASQPS